MKNAIVLKTCNSELTLYKQIPKSNVAIYIKLLVIDNLFIFANLNGQYLKQAEVYNTMIKLVKLPLIII